MGEIKVEFLKERETKRTWRFAEKGDPELHVVGTLYVKKVALKQIGDPSKLVVTITG